MPRWIERQYLPDAHAGAGGPIEKRDQLVAEVSNAIASRQRRRVEQDACFPVCCCGCFGCVGSRHITLHPSLSPFTLTLRRDAQLLSQCIEMRQPAAGSRRAVAAAVHGGA